MPAAPHFGARRGYAAGQTHGWRSHAISKDPAILRLISPKNFLALQGHVMQRDWRACCIASEVRRFLLLLVFQSRVIFVAASIQEPG
jgi:hypothetical protein